MKKHFITLLLTLLMSMVGVKAFAYDACIDGIYYNFSGSEATVTSGGSYSGHVKIPKAVTYNGKTYSVTSIGEWVFAYCSGLTSVTIGNSVTTIGSSAFRECSGLSFVTIGNSVTSIGQSAFEYCSGLTSVTIGNSVKSIGEYAFGGCSGLTSVTIPNSVTSIGQSAFVNCSGLTSITVESGNTVYDSRENCNAIILTSTNELIVGCKNTVIPNSVTSIGQGAFSGCSGLTSLTIPNSVTSIGDGAFSFCSGLTSITIPNSVTSIGWIVFKMCTALTSVTIPNSVTSIGEEAFFRCSSLTSVTCLAENVPTTDSYAFYKSNIGNATLYVPAGSVAAYQVAAPWKDFKEIVEVANIGDPTANTISLAYITGNMGKQVVLPIALNNQNAITGLQMDLYLPAGITVAKKSNGKMIIETTDRMDGNYTISSNTIDNYVRIAGYSGDGDAFTGTKGVILNVTLNIGENVADGNYTIRIKDIVLSDVNNTEYHPADVKATLTVKSYTLGDVDNSGAVNINDVVCIINYILNKPNGMFIPEAADVDGSGSININDVVTLINRFILMKGSAPALLASALLREVSIADNYLHLADISIKPGETQEIQLLMTNANEVRGVQGNIKLPAGLSFVKKDNGKVDAKNINARSEDFTLSCAIQDNGSLTFTQYSADGFAYEGNIGGIFTFKIKADENATAGTYSVDLTGVVLSIDGVGYDIPDRTSNLTITGSDGIGETLYDGGNEKWYTLDGKLLQGKPTQKGVYIVNGRVVVIK